MNTLKRSRSYLCVLVLMMLWIGVQTYSGFNDVEFNLCTSILPRDTNECSNSYKFDTISCCSVSMSYPYEGNVCFAMNKSAAGMSGNFSRQLPTNVYIQGVYTCSSKYMKITMGLFYVIILFLIM
jgi:hypothetical protein